MEKEGYVKDSATQKWVDGRKPEEKSGKIMKRFCMMTMITITDKWI